MGRVFPEGEKRSLINLVGRTIVNSPITLDKIKAIIKLSGELSKSGIDIIDLVSNKSEVSFTGNVIAASVDEKDNIRSIKVVNNSGELIPFAMMEKVKVISI